MPGGCPALHQQTNLPQDGVLLQNLSISDGCLTVDFEYSGGCVQNHRFDLVWDGTLLESFPPQVNLQLHHDSRGDLCKALIGTSLTRSLASIEDPAYHTIIVNVHAGNGTVLSIPYNY